MSSSQPAFQTSVGEDVRFGNHARQTHRILERERMERRAEANSLRTLRGGSKHCKRIRRNRELLEKVMIDDRIHIESAFVCMLDLPHDLPSHVVVRLPRRRLNFAVDPESHCSPLLLPFCRMRLRARGTLAYAIRDRPDFTVFSTKVKQRFPFTNHNILNISDEDSVVSCILCCIQSAFEISQRAMQHWSSQRSAILCLCDTHKIPKLRDRASVGGSCKVLPCKAQRQLNLARIEDGACRAIVWVG